MCGFIGFSGYYPNSKNIIGAMMDRIIHRGPDMSGEYIGDGITLGFRRLSIIDLIDGTQPMFNETGSHVIVCNGEICNFMELREQLIARGHIFKSRCDMEVILHGYEEYGEAIVLMLRGMFSFAIWNRDEKTLFCARDPFGIKPFYYTDLGGEILFGSEIKCFLEHPAFKPRVNNKALRPYLSFQYSSMDETFFTGVYKLPPAHILTFKNGKIKTKRYWEIVFEPDDKKSLADFINETDEIVRASVNAHKISDVPVGSFLSGGIDSS
ncbi:MAG: asparagine synthase (glutamine-hydrolyzing), partial [Eubacteriales bacterium]